MKKLTLDEPMTVKCKPSSQFLNLYCGDADVFVVVTHLSLKSAQSTRGAGDSGITVRIDRDEHGDFTITKVEEF